MVGGRLGHHLLLRAMVLSRSSHRVEEQDIPGILFLAFAIVLGPLVALLERDRFRALGK